MPKRILCILGSKHFYGKERSNIEVYNLLKDQADISIKVVVNKEASDELKKYVQDFDTVPIKFPDRNQEKYRYLKYGVAALGSNIKMVSTILKFRPHIIFLNDERIFYDMCLPIYFSSSKVIYRIGDQPAFVKLSNYKVNSWIWKNIVLKKTERFVYISKFIKGTVEATGRDSANDMVIYNYPPRRKENQESDTTVYLNDGQLAVGYLGQIISDKGVHLFVEAAITLLKEQDDLIFYMAGDLNYSKEFSGQLKQRVAENNMEDRVVFLGSIDDIQTFFNHIDLLVTPSMKEEPLGNVIVEAKKYGTPSIIFKSGGMPELIAHKTNGFICASSTAEEIVKGIRYYLANPELIEQHGKNAKASIEELKIDYGHFKDSWLKVFGY